ncbi:MAG: DUF5667 domain-containing protein [Candidatus Nanohaloarchaea archaeon]
MRKKTVFVFLAIFTVSAVSHGGSHSGLPEPGHLPGDTMYTVDQASETFSIMLTFSGEKKMEKQLEFAEERLSESVELMKQNRTDRAGKLAEQYLKEVAEVRNEAERKGEEEVAEDANSSLNETREILHGLSEDLPSEASTGLERAIQKSNILEEKDREADHGAAEGYVATGKVIRSGRS